MKVFAQDDLNNSFEEPGIANENNQLFENFSFNIDLIDTLIKNINLFVLSWSIFYTLVFLSHFFYHRLFYSKGKLTYEKRGMKAIYKLLGFWWRYIFCLIFLVIYGFSRSTEFGLFVGVLSIFVYFIKLYIDLGSIFDISTYHPWLKSFGSAIKKALKLN